MRRILLIIALTLFPSLNLIACSCVSAWNDSFTKTIEDSELVALVKIISFNSYLEGRHYNSDEKIPYSMTVEIVKKYKGVENRKRITIFGDDGKLCRPYLSSFQVNEHYLISPHPLDDSENTAYEFFSCRTDYLKVDIGTNTAHGKYTMFRNNVTLDTFEKQFENNHGSSLFIIAVGIIVIMMISTILQVRKKRRQQLYQS